MDALLKVVKDVQNRLDAAEIPSAVIGGLAVAAWGDPRLTRDVDLKVLAGRPDIPRLLEVLGPTYRPASLEAREFAKQFGVLFLADESGSCGSTLG